MQIVNIANQSISLLSVTYFSAHLSAKLRENFRLNQAAIVPQFNPEQRLLASTKLEGSLCTKEMWGNYSIMTKLFQNFL